MCRRFSARWGGKLILKSRRRETLMAQNQTQDAVDAIPMQKTSKTTYIAVGVGVLAVGGLLAMSLGGDKEAEKKAAEIKAQAEAHEKVPVMTAKERREHMKMTAKAFQIAEEHDKERKAEAARKKAEEDAQKAARVAAASPAHGAGAAAPPPKPRISQKAKKKQMDSLDSIGSDITSALK